jgi:hypothetical protein
VAQELAATGRPVLSGDTSRSFPTSDEHRLAPREGDAAQVLEHVAEIFAATAKALRNGLTFGVEAPVPDHGQDVADLAVHLRTDRGNSRGPRA